MLILIKLTQKNKTNNPDTCNLHKATKDLATSQRLAETVGNWKTQLLEIGDTA